MMRIVPGDLGDPRVIDLLQIHLKRARAETAPGSAHALDLAGLQSPDISFWTIWDDEVLLGFGALAVIIGAVGIYSLIAYIVSWRVREIGLRLALGAQRWQIVMAVVRQSLFLAAAGCAAGIAGTLAFGRVLHSFLFGVSALDPLTLGAVTLMMILVALTAAWIPARRAASVDPMEALRAE